MITPAFALPNVQENANSDDAYSFDVTIDGLHVTRAVIVENGIPRQLTEAEYVALMQTSLDKGTQRKTTENELPSLTQCTA